MHSMALEGRNHPMDLGRMPIQKMTGQAAVRHAAVRHEGGRLQQAVFDALPLLIAVLDVQGRVVQANAACQNFVRHNGLSRVDGVGSIGGVTGTVSVVGLPYRDVLRKMGVTQPDTLQAALAGIAAVVTGARSSFQMEHCVANAAQRHWFTMQVVPVSGLQGQVVVSHQDISELKASELASWAMANVDELTGALSRRHFLEVAQQEVSRALRYGMPLMVLMLDLDHFKQINDRHCHAAGDAVLKGFVQTVGAVLRTQDVVGRLGGEEFCVLLPNTTQDGGHALAQRIVETVAHSPVVVDGQVIDYTVSIGACCMAGESAFADLLHRADIALYGAKNGGRNRVAMAPLALAQIAGVPQ